MCGGRNKVLDDPGRFCSPAARAATWSVSNYERIPREMSASVHEYTRLPVHVGTLVLCGQVGRPALGPWSFKPQVSSA
jgi:hypothetical protein